MTEQYKSDDDLHALAGSVGESGLPFGEIAAAPAYTTNLKYLDLLDRLLAATAGALRVYKDGDLTFGVRPGRWLDGDTAVDYAGETAESLTDDAVNYVYLTADGTLTVNQTGFPDPATTAHLPLATVAVGSESAAGVSGEYAVTDITDYRGRAMLTPARGEPLRLELSGSDNADGTATMEVRVSDASGSAVARRALLRVWIADSEYAAPDAQDDFSVAAGEQMREITADADYEVITDATGLAEMTIDTATDKTVYVMAALDGRIYTGSVAVTGN